MKRLLFLFVLCPLIGEARLPDLIPYRKGDLWGFCDSTKKIIIEPKWESVEFFSGNTSKVSDGRSWGLIDRTGKQITEIKYEWISDETANGTRTAKRFRNGKKGAINDRGKLVIPFEYEWFYFAGNYLQGMKHDKIGFLNSEGEIIVPFIYDGRGDPLEPPNIPGLFIVSRDYKCGVVDTAGHIIIPFQYDWISGFGCGFIQAYTDDSTVTYFDRHGNSVQKHDSCPVAVTPLYKPFRDVFEKGNPYTWLDTNGHKPTKLQFMSTSSFSNGFADYQGFDSLYGYVNDKFEVIFPPTFVWTNPFREDGLAHVWVRDANCRSCAMKDGYVDWHGTKYWED